MVAAETTGRKYEGEYGHDDGAGEGEFGHGFTLPWGGEGLR